MSDITSYFDILGALVSAPAYYTSAERSTSNSAAGIAALGSLTVGFSFRRKTPKRLIILLLAVAVAVFLLHASIADAAGMLWPQIACRITIVAMLGCGLGLSVPGGSDDNDSGDHEDGKLGSDGPASDRNDA